jgi:hypothetical protein
VKTVLCLAVLVLASASARLLAPQEQGFPHDKHAKLFPLCAGCHTGMPSGDSAAFYPDPAMCLRCHDGVDEERVNWRAPTREISNLDFDHAVHARDVSREGTPLACETCHTPAGAGRMQVQFALAPNCLSCHAHRAAQHFADAKCETCHVPLAQTRFTTERILALPSPPSHEQPNFLTELHGRLAETEVNSCATCHTRERCSSCHVNARQVAAIGSVPNAAPAMALPRWPARYPVPASHKSASWIEKHGAEASVKTCATCHTRDDCASCHRATQARVVNELPTRSEVEAPGVVELKRIAPLSHATPDFERKHGSLAASALATCTTCHTRSECSQCHENAALTDGGARQPTPQPVQPIRPSAGERQQAPGPRVQPERSFHLPTFMLRHSSNAYGRRLECANCHDVRVFCRDCHTQSGLSTAGGSGRLQGAFHDAEPLWLLRHARAARQGLESCTSCHTQRDCLQCHSELGAFRINPHGDDFDARRAQKRNPVTCFACHVDDPLRRN